MAPWLDQRKRLAANAPARRCGRPRWCGSWRRASKTTSAEQIAADAGVSLRTFYRHFTSKHDLLFADYDAGLHWFRSALAARPADEPVIESVQAAIFAFPYDVRR